LRRCLEIAGHTAVDEISRYLLPFRQDLSSSFGFCSGHALFLLWHKPLFPSASKFTFVLPLLKEDPVLKIQSVKIDFYPSSVEALVC
jgi:hypothetical protein